MPPTIQKAMGTLFSVGFKRKTDATTGAELEAAATSRSEQDRAGFKQADDEAAAKRAMSAGCLVARRFDSE